MWSKNSCSVCFSLLLMPFRKKRCFKSSNSNRKLVIYLETLENSLFQVNPVFFRTPLNFETEKNLRQRFVDEFKRNKTKKKSKRNGWEIPAPGANAAEVFSAKPMKRKQLTTPYKVPVSRNGAEPAPRWLSHYIIIVRVADLIVTIICGYYILRNFAILKESQN